MHSKAGLLFPLLSNRTQGCWHAVDPAAGLGAGALVRGCHILKVYWAPQSCPFFSNLGRLCCACKKKHESDKGNYYVFSARGSVLGEVSLKVSRSRVL